MKTEEFQLGHGTVNFERRKYPRFNINLPIEYYQIDSAVGHKGRTINASEGGLLIHFSEPMEIGQYLKVKLHFALNAIEMLVEVVWIDLHMVMDQGDYRCGVRFVDISPEDMNKLKDFLRSLME